MLQNAILTSMVKSHCPALSYLDVNHPSVQHIHALYAPHPLVI